MTIPMPDHDADLTVRAVELWHQSIAGHPNRAALLRADILNRLLRPAATAWRQAPTGDQQLLAAADVGWRFGLRHTHIGIARAASTVAKDLRQARKRRAARPTGSAALAAAARHAGLNPQHPDYDLQLHALADAIALTGIALTGTPSTGAETAAADRQQRLLARLAKIAASVADRVPTDVYTDIELPKRLADDVLAANRAARPAEPARLLFGAVAFGWHAGLAAAEDIGAVYAVHRIAAVATQGRAGLADRQAAANWAEHVLHPVRSRLQHRLGDDQAQAAYQNITQVAAANAATRAHTAVGLAKAFDPPTDGTASPGVGSNPRRQAAHDSAPTPYRRR